VLVAEGSVWVANSGANTVSRVDPATGKVAATIGVGKEPEAIIAGNGSLWVANVTGTSLSRIDPASNRVVATIRLDRSPGMLAAGEGVIWVGSPWWHSSPPYGGRLSLAKIDPATNRVGRTVELVMLSQGWAVSIAAGGGYVWLVDDSGGLSRVDPATLLMERTRNLGKELRVMSVEGQTLWVAADGTPGTVFKLNARTGRLEDTIPAGGGYTYSAPVREIRAASTPEGVWVTDTVAGTISHVSLTGDISLPISVGNIPKGIAVGLGSVWVTVDEGS
jgi:virginiamycin B lyase